MSSYFLINTISDENLTQVVDFIGRMKKLMIDGHQILQVFFYGKAAKQTLLGTEAAKHWQVFSEKYSVPLLVCANSAVSRKVFDGVLAKEEGVSPNMGSDFKVTSLAAAFDQMAKAGYVCAAGQWRDVVLTDNSLAVNFNTQDRDSLDFKDGLDFLLLAASLDWNVTVHFQEEKYFDGALKDLFALYEVSDVRFDGDSFNDKEFKLVIAF